jgi:hypothetical protein
MQVFSEGKQLEIRRRDGVLAVKAGGDGELDVWPGAARKPQRRVRQVQVVINEFLQFTAFICAGWRRKRLFGYSFFPGSLEVLFSRQNEYLLRRVQPRHAVRVPWSVMSLLLRQSYMSG